MGSLSTALYPRRRRPALRRLGGTLGAGSSAAFTQSSISTGLPTSDLRLAQSTRADAGRYPVACNRAARTIAALAPPVPRTGLPEPTVSAPSRPHCPAKLHILQDGARARRFGDKRVSGDPRTPALPLGIATS